MGGNRFNGPAKENPSVSVTVTIPNRVNVILVRGTGEIWFPHSGDDYSVDIVIGRANDSGYLVKDYSHGSGQSFSYVRVTPGKKYDIRLESKISSDRNAKFKLDLKVYYSKTINNTTPTVIDL